jgi:hypothetical protein
MTQCRHGRTIADVPQPEQSKNDGKTASPPPPMTFEEPRRLLSYALPKLISAVKLGVLGTGNAAKLIFALLEPANQSWRDFRLTWEMFS